MKNPHAIPIFHITHIRNLPSIILTSGLLCDNERLKRGIDNLSIAHQEIKDRRARRRVPTAAGGTVADYVPFYFAPRSPMLCAISHGNVAGYQDGQDKIVYLVSNIGEACSSGQKWCFTDGHAEMALSDFYNDLRQLKQVNWKVMAGKYWMDTPEAPDQKRQRQAEFLIRGFFPWNKILTLGVKNQTMVGKVAKLLSDADYQPEIVVQSGWYY